MPLQLLRRKWILGENQPEFFSRSLVLGYFLSGLANCNNLCRNNRRTNPIWPGFFSFPFTSAQTVHSLTFVLPCWKQSMNWWPYDSQKSPANHCGKSRPSTLSMTAGLFPSFLFFFLFFLLSLSLSLSPSFFPSYKRLGVFESSQLLQDCFHVLLINCL